jgi:hypothetical protein
MPEMKRTGANMIKRILFAIALAALPLSAQAANELQLNLGETGKTVYVVVSDETGQTWKPASNAFVAYTTTRSDFANAATESPSGTGLYRRSFPATVGQRSWEWYLQVGGSPSHSDDIKIKEGSGYWGGSSFQTPGTFTTTQQAQILAALSIGQNIGVPKNLTWVVKRIDGKMQATAPIPLDIGEGPIEVAVDFRNVLGVGDAIDAVTSIQLIDDAGLETIEADVFDDVTAATIWMNSVVEFTVSPTVAGDTDRIRVKVHTVGGNTYSAPCIAVVGGAAQ